MSERVSGAPAFGAGAAAQRRTREAVQSVRGGRGEDPPCERAPRARPAARRVGYVARGAARACSVHAVARSSRRSRGSIGISG